MSNEEDDMSVEAPAREITMNAIVCHRFGLPEFREIGKPAVGDGDVLVRIHAASLNPVDWYTAVGRPYVGRVSMGLRRPKSEELGADLAGVVEAVGASVTQFKPGDEVFGRRTGGLAEYVCVPEDGLLVSKPANATFEQAAAVPVAALTALQGLRDKGRLQPGQKVLINGASGGVGTFAVQLAKWMGADVTAVCSTANVDIARSLGADRVIDYTREDFTRSGVRYDLILDIAGSRSWSDCKRVLMPNATFVIIGGPKTNRVLGPLSHVVKVRLAAVRSSRKVIFFMAKMDTEDLGILRELLETGQIISVIDRQYELSEVPDALAYLGEGHARGKIVISV
jgi:NADPH:quinone reductase-like Zn-dependent oxidoreductase